MTDSKSREILLEEIRADIITYNVCPQLAVSSTNLVFGVGDPNADVIFIGEAPGKKEDELGEPFVGASGQFLNDMLKSIQLNRNQIYITNIVKYRPPNNRDPLPQEKEDFLPYLERQLDVIKPLLIVTLGRHSMNAFLPGQQISQIHGQPKRIKRRDWGIVDYRQGKMKDSTTNYQTSISENWIILPLYHPAAALYNGALRKTLEEDFKNINKLLTRLRKEKEINK